MWLALLPTALLPMPPLLPSRCTPTSRFRATAPQAKFVGAALAAAFAAKDDDEAPPAELTIEEKEERVVQAITKGLDANQMVITTNLLNLKHGMPVQLKVAGSSGASQAKN